MYTYIYTKFLIFQEEIFVKPSTPETTIKIENKLQDPANALSVNSVDGRLQVITKSTSSNPLINIRNLDGTVTGVTLPSGYQGMFMLPFALGTGGITSSGLSEFYFVKEGVVADTNPAYGITRTSMSNGGKHFYVNSSGRLAKVPNDTTPRINYGKNKNNGFWEKKGLLLEFGNYNILKPNWTTGATFGVTGAAVTVVTNPTEVAPYWDSTTIPDGLSVWKLTETTSAGFSAENTAFIQASSIATPLTVPYHFDFAGVSFSNFMVSAFFTGTHKPAGITKDVVQIWLSTNVNGTIKKSVFFDLNQCKPVSVSSGGITLIHFSTEQYDNGWCRCLAGIGYTGATYPTSAGIPQFGFSTGRPDGSGGYTYGRLLGGSAGYLYFSGVKIDYGPTGEVTRTTQWNSNKLSPSSYVPPNGTTKYTADALRYDVKPYPNWFYPENSLDGNFASTAFYDLVVHGAVGISGGSDPITADVPGGGYVLFVNGRFLNNAGSLVGQHYPNSLVLGLGLSQSGIPAWRGTFYSGTYQSGAVLFGLTSSNNVPTKSFYHRTGTVGSSTERGYTFGERFKLVQIVATGDYRSYLNGFTGLASALTGPTYPNWIGGSTGQVWYFSQNNKDKVINLLNWSWSPRALSETEGIATTSFGAQGVPAFNVSGEDGGYNESSGNYGSLSELVTVLDNTSIRPPTNPLPSVAI